MLRARARGRLLQGEADYQLHIIYLWYEQQPARALSCCGGSSSAIPAIPTSRRRSRTSRTRYEHDLIASLDTWRALLAAAREQRVNVAALAEVQARLGIARLLESLYQTDHAIEQLQARRGAEAGRARTRRWRCAFLRLARRHDRLGARGAAAAAYRSAIAAAPRDDPLDVRAQAASAAAPRAGCEKGRGLSPLARGLAAARAERSARPPAHRSSARSRSIPTTGGAAIGTVACCRRGTRTTPRSRSSSWRSGTQRACPAPISATPSSKPRGCTSAPAAAPTAIDGYRVAATLFGAAADTRAAAQRALERIVEVIRASRGLRLHRSHVAIESRATRRHARAAKVRVDFLTFCALCA